MRKSLLLVIYLFTSYLNYLVGQELKVKNFQENLTDISARENQVLDVNSNPSALVKIYTGLTGLVIDGNRGVEKMEVMPGAVWVWLPEGTSQLKISREGMPMFVYSLPLELTQSTVYSFELESDQLFSVIINTGSVNAEVSIRDSIYNTNSTITGLLEDKYPIRIEKLGYLLVEDTIDVNESNLYFSYTLKRSPQEVIKINSLPAGAVVLINGEHVGSTNFSGYRFPGEYHLQITMTNYTTIDTTIVFDPAAQNTYDFELIKNTGWLKPIIFPTDAEISIDGSSVIPGIKELNAGSGHSISVYKYRYRILSEAFQVPRGDTLTMFITLEPEQGDLSFIIEPGDADIKMNKTEINLDIDEDFMLRKWNGSTQLTMPVGEYSLKAKRKGYLTVDTIFSIPDAKTKYLYMTMPVKKLNRGSAIALSFLFPGMGQYYSQRKAAGTGFLTAGILSLSVSGYYFYLSENQAKEYNNAKIDYQEETSVSSIIAKRELMDNKYQSYRDAVRLRDICLGITAGIWFINIVDAGIFTKLHKPVLRGSIGNDGSYRLTASPGTNSIGASLNIRF